MRLGWIDHGVVPRTALKPEGILPGHRPISRERIPTTGVLFIPHGVSLQEATVARIVVTIAEVVEARWNQLLVFPPNRMASILYQYLSTWICPGAFFLCSLKPWPSRISTMFSIMPGLPQTKMWLSSDDGRNPQLFSTGMRFQRSWI